LRRESDKGPKDREIGEKELVLEGDNRRIGEKGLGSARAEQGNSYNLLVVSAADQTLDILFNLFLIFDKKNPPVLAVLELIISLF